ncbi:MAG: 3-hydroxyacyl-ACP dehydratase FabZ family protein [Phycisphaerae bacterium]
MKFILIDKICSIEPGRRIVASKNLSLAEEYLQDHFPAFPILPGVLMIEAATQAAAWLVRVTQNWSRSIVVCSAAKNVKYSSFVKPGQTLRCEVEAMRIDEDTAKVKFAGYVGDTQNVSGRLELSCFNLVDRAGYLADADASILAEQRKQFELVGGPAALEAACGA